MKMTLVYLAGPYRADTIYEKGNNIWRARCYAIALWKLGYAVICPHTNGAFFDGCMPVESFLEGDLEMLRRCDMIAIMPGSEDSEGTQGEIREAKRLRIPFFDMRRLDV